MVSLEGSDAAIPNVLSTQQFPHSVHVYVGERSVFFLSEGNILKEN